MLVGRERELDELQHSLELAGDGKGRTVFISAEAGVGKTRLLQEFINCAKGDKNIVVLSGWCLFNAGVPYFPFIEAFSNYYSALGEKSGKEELELNSWLKGPAKSELSGKLEYLSPQALKDRTFAAVAKAIHSIASQNRVVLVIEDIHWADSASLALIHYIARGINNSEKVLVLATFRSEELTSDSEGYPHILIETLSMMRREDLFSEIKLANLNQTCIAKMAESMLGGRLGQELAEKLAVESEGNPLFVVESLRMLHESKYLVLRKGEWNLTTKEIGMPYKIKDIIIQRLARLNHAQRQILDVASVIGEEFDVGLLSAVIEQDSLEVLETLNIISHSTALVRFDENRSSFDHARSREALYEALAPLLRREYHGRIAECLENAKTAVFPASDLAYHFALAGNKEKAAKYALAAANDELKKWSNTQAIKHFQYALQNIPDEHSEERRTALEGLGDAYAANCMYAEAIKAFDELAASETGVIRLRALRKAMDAAFLKGDKPDLLLEYAKKAEELATYDRLEMARVLENRGRAFAWAGRGDGKLDLADYEGALKVFEEENSLADVAEALGRHGEASIFTEDLREKALGELLRSVAIFGELGDTRKQIEATFRLGWGYAFDFRLLTEAKREFDKVLDAGEKLGMFVELARANGILSRLDESEGKLTEALPRVLKALEFCEKTDAGYVQGLELAAATRLYSKLGDLRRADDYFDKLTRLPPEVRSTALDDMFILLTKGVYFAAKGRSEESNRVFERIANSGNIGLEEDYAWMLEKLGRIEEVKAQRNKIQKIKEQSERRYEHTNVQLSAMMPRKVQVGEEFEVRLDIVNVARHPGIFTKIEGTLPPDSKVVSLPSFCSVRNHSIEMNEKRIEPFDVATIKVKIAFAKEGAYEFHPCLYYLTDQRETKTSETNPINVVVSRAACGDTSDSFFQSHRLEPKFESEYAEKAFEFLLSAFNEDYLARKLPLEKSGWRTQMEIVKDGHVTMNSMYGRSGRGGKARLELERLGLVESRFFSGERGRGGSVLKLRVSFEKEGIKRS